jgi:hypothetical protein
MNDCHGMKVRNLNFTMKTATSCHFLYHVTCQKMVIVTHSSPVLFSDVLKVILCQVSSGVLLTLLFVNVIFTYRCHLLQRNFKCSLLMHQSQNVQQFLIIYHLFSSISILNVRSSKYSFHIKMAGLVGKNPVTGAVNVLILIAVRTSDFLT